MAQENDIVIKSYDLGTFLEMYSYLGSTELLTAIWEFGNKQYDRGYNDGHYGFDDDNDSEYECL